MAPEDIKKTSFFTHRAVYAYKIMHFSLTNTEGTYQRRMIAIIGNQLGQNMESYMDDMIAKSKKIPDHINDLKECFNNLQNKQIKLN